MPTWDYISVHTYGKAEIVDNTDDVKEILVKIITKQEPEYIAQWISLPEKKKLNMIKAITAFKIEIDAIDFKEKLSQDKSKKEIAKIKQSLNDSELPSSKILSEYYK